MRTRRPRTRGGLVEDARLAEALLAAAEAADEASADPGDEAEPLAICDEAGHRRLVFGPQYVQSQMALDDPWALNLVYTQKMAAFLLFQPRPRHVVIVGLGGGSLTKFVHRALPKARSTTLEIDARVIGLAAQFKVPLDAPRTRIVHADACAWFAPAPEPADVILLDGYTEAGLAGGFGAPAFHAQLKAALRPGGVLVANLLVPSETFRAFRASIAAVFDGPVLVQKVVPDGNHVLFAFKAPLPAFDWVAIAREAKALRERHALDFPAFARALRRSHERGEAAEPEVAVALL